MLDHLGSSRSYLMKEPLRARVTTIHHRSHLGAFLRPITTKERETHPWGSHRPRIDERLIFDKLVQVVVFGCAYERISDESCSATTLRVVGAMNG